MKKMRSFLSLLLAFTLVFGLTAPVGAVTEPEVPEVIVTPSVETINVGTGTASVIYTISVNPNGNKVGAIGFNLSAPEGMTLVTNKLPNGYANQGGNGYWLAIKDLKLAEDEDTGDVTGIFENFDYTPDSGYFTAYGTTETRRLETEAVLMTIQATVDISAVKTYTLGIENFVVGEDGDTDLNGAYTVTDVQIVKAPETISSVSVGVTAPAVGAAPSAAATVPDDANYTVGEVTWAPDTDEFVSEQAYTATVTVTPADGYCFPEDISTGFTVTVNGEAAEATRNENGTLTVTYKFPAIEKSLIGLTISGNNTATIPATGSETVQLEVTGTYDNGNTTEPEGDVTWSLLEPTPNGVTVSENGLVTIPAGTTEGTIKVKVAVGAVEDVHEIVISKAASVATTIEISGADEVAIPAKAVSPKEETYTATVKDQYGNEMSVGTIQWTMTGNELNVGLSVDGKLNVTNESKPGTVTIKAAYGADVYETKDIKITKADAVPVITVTGDSSVAVPVKGAEAVAKTYSATAEDQFGGTNYTPVLSIKEGTTLPEGVTFNAATGELTVDPCAAAGTVTIVATVGTVEVEKVVEIARGELVATTVEIWKGDSKITEDTISIPNTGSEEETYTAKVFNQYGEPMENASVSWSVDSNTATNVSASNGTVTVPSTAEAGVLVYRASVAATNLPTAPFATVTITISNLPDQNITCADVAGTYGQTEALALNPQGKETSGAYTFAVKSGSSVEVDNDGKLTIKAVGETVITVTAPGDDNYAETSIDVTVTIEKADITPEVTIEDWTYGDLANEPSLTAGSNPGDGAVTYEYKVKDADDDTYSATVPSAVGDYTVKATVAETDNYKSGSDTADFEITKASISPEVSIVGWTYGDEANAPAVDADSNPGNGNVTYQYKAKGAADSTYTDEVPTDAGDYIVKATVAETDNYNAGSDTAEFTIAKADIKFSVTLADWTYGKDAETPVVEGYTGNDVTYAYKAADAEDSAYSATVPTNAGDYIVKASVVGNSNYNDFSATDDFAITKADITPEVTIEGWTYGETANEPSVTGNSGNGAVTYTYKIKGADDSTYSDIIPTAVGEYTVKATVAETGNYNGGSDTADFEITVKQVAIPAADTTVYTYTGAAQTYKLTVSDDYDITDATKTDADTYTVTVTLKDKDNTEWADGTTTDKTYEFVINKALITITAKDQSITVGETAPELDADDYTVSGLVGSDTLTKAPAIAYEVTPDTSKTGTYKIIVSGAEASANYTISYVYGELTIEEESAIRPSRPILPFFPIFDPGCICENYVDLNLDAWYHDGIHFCLYTGLMNGMSEDTFAPNGTMTRAMVWTVLGRMAGETFNGTGTYWYAEAQAWAMAAGVSDGTNPNGAVTRQELVTMLWRFVGEPEADTDVLVWFNDDETIADWAVEAMAWAVQSNIIEGTNWNLNPQATALRSQVAAILMRYCKKF